MWKTPIIALTICLALTAMGCQRVTEVFDRDWQFDKPTVSVIAFENRAPFPMAWNLGDGFAEVLTTELLETGRFHVVDRRNIDALLSELALQQSDVTRGEQRAPLGRVRNAQYLVLGTVTDFSHTARGGFGAVWRLIGFMGRGWVARVSMIIQVIDVETSEILLAQQVDGNVWAAEGDISTLYGGVAFGGNAFYQTPLGRATRKTISRGMDDIINVIGRQRWQPRLARVDEDGSVIINGGQNRRLEVGTRFDAVELGDQIFDPVTGDAIGREESEVIGLIEVTEVLERHSYGRIVDQSAELQVGARMQNPQHPPREGWTH